MKEEKYVIKQLSIYMEQNPSWEADSHMDS